MDEAVKGREYGCLCCKCKNRHDLLTWVNMGMAIALLFYSVFAFINFFNSIGVGFFFQFLLPAYFA